jgi:hypothetical protein
MNEFRIDDGVIRTPGKFEGEPAYVPYFWDAVGNGFSETLHWSGDEVTDIVEIGEEDRAEWPEIPADAVAIHIQEMGGFVYGELLTERELEELYARNEADVADLDESEEDEE